MNDHSARHSKIHFTPIPPPSIIFSKPTFHIRRPAPRPVDEKLCEAFNVTSPLGIPRVVIQCLSIGTIPVWFWKASHLWGKDRYHFRVSGRKKISVGLKKNLKTLLKKVEIHVTP
jgi:hypothetical protein